MTLAHEDHDEYFKYSTKSRLDKFINSLLGIIEGIAIDGIINNKEIDFLRLWIDEYSRFQALHPYNELLPVVNNAIEDGILDSEEREDIIWLCHRIGSRKYFNQTTADIQQLHGILGGIIADGIVSETELSNLSEWLSEHEHLRTCWPYDEVDSLITGVMADQKIDNSEHQMLLGFFSDFISLYDDNTITKPYISTPSALTGLCSVCPEIKFSDSLFCLTGTSCKYTRKQFTGVITSLGGRVTKSVTNKIDYLIIGADGNPCWAYACYGRKIEKAVDLRKKGAHLMIVHENDFHDAIEDIDG